MSWTIDSERKFLSGLGSEFGRNRVPRRKLLEKYAKTILNRALPWYYTPDVRLEAMTEVGRVKYWQTWEREKKECRDLALSMAGVVKK